MSSNDTTTRQTAEDIARQRARLKAALNLLGQPRRALAQALNLSQSALNRKLRGDLALFPEEIDKIKALIASRGGRP